jgi:glycosyltransferase involved in cell wall biosynthesis
MRLAIVNSHRSIVGGIETYLRKLLPALAERGHEVAFFHEEAAAAGHELITLPEGAPTWSVVGLGAARAVAALQQWQPDIIYLHSLHSPETEALLQQIAPTVFFAHAYYGSCVSGTKTFSFPQAEPCDRQFGLQCLLHYYPRRCGGLNPLTMLRDYELQTKRLSLLGNYAAIIVASSHMLREYEKYGLADKLSLVRLPVTIEENPATPAQNGHQRKERWRIMFLARMESLKGGAALLEALPKVARASEIPVHVTFAGEGRRKQEWQQRAAQLANGNRNLEFTFTGWLNESQRAEVLRECDLLVMPSLWPEPFGLAGIEAGLFGVPVVAFATGGITDWLKDGINGALAQGNPPSTARLADAILSCIRDENFYLTLRRGAFEQAQQFQMKEHLSALLEIFERLSLKN